MLFPQGRYLRATLLIAAGLVIACSQSPTSTQPPDTVDRGETAAGSAPAVGDRDTTTSVQRVEPEPPPRTATHDRSDTNPATLASANNRFGLDLYDRLRQLPGNLFFSPHSISTALTMTYAGARGATATEMATALRLPDGDVHTESAALGQSLVPESTAYELRIANRLWAQQGLTLQDEFRRITERYYFAEVGLLDFEHASEPARKTINNWVDIETNHKIPDLLPRGSINTLTRLVLTNAIYFKGTWVRQFDENQTRDAAFFGEAQQSVPLMYQRANFDYAETDVVQALRLPYEGDALSMLVLLPRDRNGLPALENQLNSGQIESLISTMSEVEADVWLPRFATGSEFELTRILIELGMNDAFDPSQADFSGISGKKGLFISRAIHKALVEVNEEGSEAAAATAVVIGVESDSPVVSFRADHPFVFMIRDDRSGAVLFLGRLVSPQS